MPGGVKKKEGTKSEEISSRIVGRDRRGSDPKDRDNKDNKESTNNNNNNNNNREPISREPAVKGNLKTGVSRMEKRVGREMRPMDPKVEIPIPRPESKSAPKTPTKTQTGKVTLEFANGDVYEGFAANDKKHGPNGSYVFSSGDIYSGEWVNGFAQGKGTLTFVKSDTSYIVNNNNNNNNNHIFYEDLWAHGACLRLVPSVSFQLTGFDDERERAAKKSSVNNMLEDWKQVIGGEEPPQAGIYTVEYLYSRLLNEGDSKYWLSWLYFCTKWEKSGYGSTSIFLAFPDLSRGGFMSLTQVLISSGLLEKLVMKYVVSPAFPAAPSSPSLTPTGADVPSNPSSDHYDTEVQKLFALCLDLDEDEALIQTTIKRLKSTRDYVRPLLSTIPPYFSHSIAQSVSIFKKSHSSALHFLSQKTAALEKRIYSLASLPPPPVNPAAPAQRGSVTPSILPQQLKLLLQFYKERAQFSLFENLETAPRVVQKVLTTSAEIQAFVERKIAVLERDDLIFAQNMDELRQSHIKENEQNEANAEMYLQLYIQNKSSSFKTLAEEHKRDVQMMEYIRKTCEELYESLYNKAIDTTLNHFNTAKALIEKVVSNTIDKEILEICAQIADVISRQVSELHRIIHFYATFTSEKIDTYIKEIGAISQKIQDILNPPPPVSTQVTSPSTPSYLSMAFNFTKGIIKNVTQYTFAEDTNDIDKSQVEAHTYKPINISTLKGETVLLSALLRDHTDSDLIAKFLATVLVHMCSGSRPSFSKDLIASAILCVKDCPFAELRAASLNILQSHYGQDDEHRKEFVVNFMSVLVSAFESSLKELSPPVGTAVCDLLGALTNGTDDVKAAVVTKIGIKKLIDLMDIGARQPQGEAVVYSAAQVLANIAAKEEYLVEISSKGGLHRVLEVAKVGKIKAHMHIPEDQLQLSETLGTGTFAEVKRGLWQNKAVAIKIFREAAFTFRLEDFWKEVAIMSLIKHDNILRLLGASIAQRKENSTFMLVTELMHKGTLRDIIRTVGPLPPPVIVKYALDVALGLAYMHTLDILHRDIKASNILVDEEDHAKVGDLGLSRVNNNLNMTQFTGTPKWEAPECLISSQYSKSADVYSYGVVLSEMVTGEEPFPEINDLGELKKVVVEQKLRPKLPPKAPNCPPFLTSLIKACWSHDPKKRPTFEQIVELLSAPPLNQ